MTYQKNSDRDKLNKEKGSIAVLVAISLSVLLGLAVFVTDLGILYVKHTHLQSALDSAVLAGAQDLPQSTALAQQTADQYAATNGVSPITVGFTAHNMKISASAQEQVPAFFARIWGITENTISASAAAVAVPPSGMKGLIPLALREQELSYGTEYTLKVGAGDCIDTGWFGCLDFYGSGAHDYAGFVENGYPGSISIGEILHVEHGNISGPSKKAIQDRLARDTRIPKNTFADHDANAPEIVYVPIVRVSTTPVTEVQVVGFAAFFLEGITGGGQQSIIKGRFLKTIVLNGKEDGSLSDLQQNLADLEGGTLTNDFGLYAVKLVS